MPEITHPSPDLQQPLPISAQHELSAKVATIAMAGNLLQNPAVDTSVMDRATFDPVRDRSDAEEYVANKPERFAIAAVISDAAIDDLVTQPLNPRDARFRSLPHITSMPDSSHSDEAQPVTMYGSGDRAVDWLKTDIHAVVIDESEQFLEKHPELSRAAMRFALISDTGESFPDSFRTHREVVENIVETMNFIVLNEFLPFAQRLIHENQNLAELSSPTSRTEFAKDIAKQLLFDTAALNLGHLQHISASDTAWEGFMFGTHLQGMPVKRESGEWKIVYDEGYERPAKPKTNLAGPTIGCPALLKLEADKPGSPLHRLIYATLNEAAARGVFEDDEIEIAVMNLELSKQQMTKDGTQHDLYEPRGDFELWEAYDDSTASYKTLTK